MWALIMLPEYAPKFDDYTFMKWLNMPVRPQILEKNLLNFSEAMCLCILAMKLLDALLDGCTSGQQQQHILVLRLSVSKEQMVISSQPVCLTQPPLKGHGCCFGGCPSLLSVLMAVISSATNPWNMKRQNFGSFSIPLQQWSLKTKRDGSWDHAGGYIVWPQTPLQEQDHQCLTLAVQWVTLFPHMEYSVLGLW